MGTVALLGLLALLMALYAAFHAWYGGRGQPLNTHEIEDFMRQLAGTAPPDSHRTELLESVRQLVAKDDGREFVMQNLVRYRAKALYPPGYSYNDDPRAADQRYGKAIVPHLLRCGSLPIFIAKRSGSFLEPEGADSWHYVAMVRYRSRRDFLRFALRIEQQDVAVHKWAAIEKTHVFPVQPIVSLLAVRSAVATALLMVGLMLVLLLR
jgi:hypothetical protein